MVYTKCDSCGKQFEVAQRTTKSNVHYVLFFMPF